MKKGKFKGAILACSLLAFGAIVTTTTFGLTSCGGEEQKPVENNFLTGVTAFEIANKEEFDFSKEGYAWYPDDADKEIKFKFTGAEVNLLKAFKNKQIEITSSDTNVASVINNYVAPKNPGEATLTIVVHTDKTELKQELKVKVSTPVAKPTAKEIGIADLLNVDYNAWLAARPQQDYIVTGKVVDWYRDPTPSKYGNFNIQDEKGNKILVYGATKDESALTYNKNGTWKFSNPKNFLDKDGNAPFKIGDTVKLHVVLTIFNNNLQLNAVIQEVTPGTGEGGGETGGETIACKDINEVLAKEDGTALTVKGKAIDVIDKTLVLQDKTNFIEVRAAEAITDIKKGDVVTVTGTRGSYAKSGAQQINATEIKKITETLDVAEPTKATKVDANFFTQNSEEQLKAMHTFIETEGEFIVDGSFFNLIIDGTDKQVSVKTSDTTLTTGRRYKMKGFASGYSGGRFLNVFITSYSEIAFEPVTSVEITNGETAELFVDKTIKLDTKVLPETADPTVTYEVTEGKEFASVDAEGNVKGLKPGTAKITVKSKASADKTDMITVTVKETPTLSGEVVAKTYTLTFAEKLANTAGGSVDLGGLTWNYDAAGYYGFDSAKGIQVGSSSKPVTEPWSLQTTLPCEVTLKSYSAFLSCGSKGSHSYEIKYGTISDKGTNDSTTPFEIKKEGLTAKTTTFGVTLSAAVKAAYIKSISFVIDVPVEYESLFTF